MSIHARTRLSGRKVTTECRYRLRQPLEETCSSYSETYRLDQFIRDRCWRRSTNTFQVGRQRKPWASLYVDRARVSLVLRHALTELSQTPNQSNHPPTTQRSGYFRKFHGTRPDWSGGCETSANLRYPKPLDPKEPRSRVPEPHRFRSQPASPSAGAVLRPKLLVTLSGRGKGSRLVGGAHKRKKIRRIGWVCQARCLNPAPKAGNRRECFRRQLRTPQPDPLALTEVTGTE